VAEVGSSVSIMVVTVQELFSGWVVRINNATELEDLVRLYGRLSRTISLCKRVPVAEFDGAAGDCYRKILIESLFLSKKRLQKDMRIAVIAWGNCRHAQLPRFFSGSRAGFGGLDKGRLSDRISSVRLTQRGDRTSRPEIFV
jgi:tRNA(fMet)-specific endonuclease VapC